MRYCAQKIIFCDAAAIIRSEKRAFLRCYHHLEFSHHTMQGGRSEEEVGLNPVIKPCFSSSGGGAAKNKKGIHSKRRRRSSSSTLYKSRVRCYLALTVSSEKEVVLHIGSLRDDVAYVCLLMDEPFHWYIFLTPMTIQHTPAAGAHF